MPSALSPHSPPRSRSVATGLLLWAFILVIPLFWLHLHPSGQPLSLPEIGWMVLPLLPLIIGAYRGSPWILMVLFPVCLLIPLVLHPMTTTHTVHGWGSILAILMSGALHFHVSSRMGRSLSITAPAIPRPLNARHGARICILLILPLLALERLMLNPEWLLHDAPGKLAGVQSQLIVFAAIIWVVTLRLHRTMGRVATGEKQRELPGQLMTYAITLLLVIRALLPTETP